MTAGRFCACPFTILFLRGKVHKSKISLVNDIFIGFNLSYSQSFYIFASSFSTTIHIDKSKTFQKKDMNEESYQQQPFNTIQHKKSMIEPTKTETEMKARAYGRTELAMMYCPQDTPGAAWRKLRQWTEHCPDLLKRLQDLGYTGHQRTFTPAQVKWIFYYLGEP